jgi:hypothetical protein
MTFAVTQIICAVVKIVFVVAQLIRALAKVIHAFTRTILAVASVILAAVEPSCTKAWIIFVLSKSLSKVKHQPG